MLVLWLLHCGTAWQEAAEIVGLGRATVHRYVVVFREGGLDGLRWCDHHHLVSEMAACPEVSRKCIEERPARTIAEARERILQRTGLRRGTSHVRKFLKDMGLKFHRVCPVPGPPKRTWPSTPEPRPISSRPN